MALESGLQDSHQIFALLVAELQLQFRHGRPSFFFEDTAGGRVMTTRGPGLFAMAADQTRREARPEAVLSSSKSFSAASTALACDAAAEVDGWVGVSGWELR